MLAIGAQGRSKSGLTPSSTLSFVRSIFFLAGSPWVNQSMKQPPVHFSKHDPWRDYRFAVLRAKEVHDSAPTVVVRDSLNDAASASTRAPEHSARNSLGGTSKYRGEVLGAFLLSFNLNSNSLGCRSVWLHTMLATFWQYIAVFQQGTYLYSPGLLRCCGLVSCAVGWCPCFISLLCLHKVD